MPRPMRAECCALVPGLVSVVLPVYNGAPLLEGAIRSVLGQTYPLLELIIVNDGSTDGVEAILDRFSSQPNVRIITQPNRGLPGALTRGFADARGEFWTWTSADNLMHRRQLERMVGKFMQEPDLGMTYADYWVIDERGNPLADRTWRPHNRPAPATGEVRLPRSTATLNGIPDNFIGPCFLYRGWIGRLLGAYDGAQGVEDYDYWMRINAHFAIRHLGTDELLYWYRVHADTLSANAQEHAIVDKVAALMDTEQARALHNAIPPQFDVEPAAAAWLAVRGAVLGPGGLAVSKDASSAATTVVTMASSAAVTSAPSTAGHAVPLVLICTPDNSSPDDLAHWLERPNVLAVTSDERVAARIRAVSTVPVVDGESSNLVAAIEAYAHAMSFSNGTRRAAGLSGPAELLR